MSRRRAGYCLLELAIRCPPDPDRPSQNHVYRSAIIDQTDDRLIKSRPAATSSRTAAFHDRERTVKKIPIFPCVLGVVVAHAMNFMKQFVERRLKAFSHNFLWQSRCISTHRIVSLSDPFCFGIAEGLVSDDPPTGGWSEMLASWLYSTPEKAKPKMVLSSA